MVSKSSDAKRAAQREYWDRDQGSRRKPDHPAVRALFEPRAAFLRTLCESSAENPAVLDVGCGNGFLTVPLSGLFRLTVGVDLSMPMLARNPSRPAVCGSVLSLPFSDSSFDVVVCSHLLHHLTESDRYTAVAEMARVSRGAVVLYEPNRNNPLMLLFAVLNAHERMSAKFTPAYVRTLLSDAHLSEVTTRVEGTSVPNKMPAGMAAIAARLNESPLRALGFYVCGTGHKRLPTPHAGANTDGTATGDGNRHA